MFFFSKLQYTLDKLDARMCCYLIIIILLLSITAALAKNLAKMLPCTMPCKTVLSALYSRESCTFELGDLNG